MPPAPKSAAAAARDAEVLKLRMDGLQFDEIGRWLGVTKQRAHQLFERGLARTRQEQADALRRLEQLRLDHLYAEALGVLRREHVVVDRGEIIKDDAGHPLKDDGPVLSAIDRLLKIQDRRAKLLCLDAPAKHEVLTLDAIDAEVYRLEAELGLTHGGAEAGQAAAAPGAAG